MNMGKPFWHAALSIFVVRKICIIFVTDKIVLKIKEIQSSNEY